MEKIIEPVALDLIKAELTDERKLMDTNKGGNELYVVDCHNAPNTLREIGRLREITYRAAGGCSGKSMDLDEYDLMDKPYQQIIVWDPDAQAIIGGYRYILGTDVSFDEKGQPKVTSSHLYHFTDKFIRDYLPYTMELGRSFVRPEYQTAATGRKSLFTLDNLWDGITGVVLSSPCIDYLFGKMTIYNSYDKAARELILHFLEKHFPDNDCLARPYQTMVPDTDPRILELLLNEDRLKADYRNLKDAVHRLGTNIPPLINSYINTSSTMKIFGSTVNDELSNAIETGLMIRFSEINLEKKERHIRAFIEKRMPRFRRIRRTDLITPEIEFK